MIINYINLSNILYQRITTNKIESKFLLQILAKELIYMMGQLILKISLLTNENFQRNCSNNNDWIWTSIIFTIVCFGRFVIYLSKRTDMSFSKDENVLLAVDYIQEYVNDNELSITVDNRNCDFILHHLSNFIQLSKSSNYREQADQPKGNANKL